LTAADPHTPCGYFVPRADKTRSEDLFRKPTEVRESRGESDEIGNVMSRTMDSDYVLCSQSVLSADCHKIETQLGDIAAGNFDQTWWLYDLGGNFYFPTT
jgi:hypothetical protein